MSRDEPAPQPEPEPDSDPRWPRSVYGIGDEPDPRFSFANERTFLAWVRTALALIAGGVALTAYGEVTERRSVVIVVGSVLLSACGLLSGVGALINWARNERAMRLNRPLPGTPLLPVLVVVLIVFGVIAIVLGVNAVVIDR